MFVKPLLLSGLLALGVIAAPQRVSSIEGTDFDVYEVDLDKRAGFPPGYLPAKQDVINTYMHRPSPAQPCLFYNIPRGNMTHERIQAIAVNIGAVALYDVYNADYYPETPFNQYRFPMSYFNQQQRSRDWFRYTSRIFAEVCRNRRVYLLWDRNQPFSNPVQDWHAIWSTDEFEAIYFNDNTFVQEVVIVNPANGQPESTPYWTRGQVAPSGWIYELPNSAAGAPSRTPTTNLSPPASRRTAAPKPVGDSVLLPKHEPADGTIDGRTPMEVMNETANRKLQRERLNKNKRLDRGGWYGIEQAPDLTVFTKGEEVGWVPGTCKFDFIHTITAGPPGEDLNNQYLNLTLYDMEQTNVIGGLDNVAVGSSGGGGAMGSRLPYTLLYTVADSSHPQYPIQFAYAGISWTSDNVTLCSTGSYSSFDGRQESRKGDCVFPCNPLQ